jgi:histidine triad (HIT) family protein
MRATVPNVLRGEPAGGNTAAMEGCPFCAIATGTAPAHEVLRDSHVVAFLDRRPVFPGHVLVVPVAHLVTLTDVPPAALGPLFERVQRMATAVERGLGADGSFVAMNNTVSQSVPHLHVHVVPRRRKDGLRGFFWPRQRYADDAAMDEVAGRIRGALR